MNEIENKEFDKFIIGDLEKLTTKFYDLGITIIGFNASEKIEDESSIYFIVNNISFDVKFEDYMKEKYMLAIMRVINQFNNRIRNPEDKELISVMPTTQAINIKDNDNFLDHYSIDFKFTSYKSRVSIILTDFRHRYPQKEYIGVEKLAVRCNNYLAIRALMNKIYDEIIKATKELKEEIE